MLKVVNMKDFNKRGFALMDVTTNKFVSLNGKKPMIMTKKKAKSVIGAHWLSKVYQVEI